MTTSSSGALEQVRLEPARKVWGYRPATGTGRCPEVEVCCSRPARSAALTAARSTEVSARRTVRAGMIMLAVLVHNLGNADNENDGAVHAR